MFDNIRNKTKSITTKIFLLLIAASFALWGVGDIFSNKSDPIIVYVGEEQISSREFIKNYQRVLSDLRQNTNGQITDEIALSLNIHNQTLNQMINEKIIDLEAKNMNISIPKETLKKSIIRSPFFQDQLGQFNQEQFQYTLRQLGMDEKEYLEQLSKALLREQVYNIFYLKNKVPSLISEIYYKIKNEERNVKAISFSANNYIGIKKNVTEELINRHFEEFKNDYLFPENRSFTIMSIKPDDIIDSIKIEEEQIKREYDYYPEKYIQSETRQVFLVNLGSREEAQDLFNKITDTNQFLQLASSFTQKEPGDLDLGFVAINDLPESLGQKVFNANLLTLYGPEETPFGWRLYLVNNIKEGNELQYSDVKDKIAEELKINIAIDKIYDLGNTFYDEIASGASITEAAESINAGIKIFNKINKNGTNFEGNIIENLPPYPELLETVFTTNLDEISNLISSIGNTLFAVQINQIDYSRQKNITESREDIIKDIETAENIRLAEYAANEFIDRIKEGKSFESLVKENNLLVFDLKNIKLDGSGAEGILNRKALDKVFSLDINEITEVIPYDEKSFTVSKLLEIKKINDIVEEDLIVINETLNKNISEDLRRILITILSNKYEIKINNNLFDSLFM